LREIANSPLVSETSIHAQELRLLRERQPNSPAKLIQDIEQARAERNARRGQDATKAKNDTVKEIKDSIKNAIPKNKNLWSKFVESLKC
jgi:protein required for attachment to host cells